MVNVVFDDTRVISLKSRFRAWYFDGLERNRKSMIEILFDVGFDALPECCGKVEAGGAHALFGFDCKVLSQLEDGLAHAFKLDVIKIPAEEVPCVVDTDQARGIALLVPRHARTHRLETR